jgi:hypothetical protein
MPPVKTRFSYGLTGKSVISGALNRFVLSDRRGQDTAKFGHRRG